eukprot:15550893-Heterocapsa_arctica.AAC.1
MPVFGGFSPVIWHSAGSQLLCLHQASSLCRLACVFCDLLWNHWRYAMKPKSPERNVIIQECMGNHGRTAGDNARNLLGATQMIINVGDIVVSWRTL